jgi:hypothetical protein
VKKRIRLTLIASISLIIILLGSFFIYASDYYRADEVANAVLQSKTVTSVEDNFIMLSPTAPGDTVLIFYPGAKVEYISYLPLLEKIVQSSKVTCLLIKMPFNMAIFNPNAADHIISRFPDVENWYIAGHSMGGAMASDYASKNQDKIKGLILLGAYIYGDYPAENSLTVYGSFNTSVEEKITYTENIVVIEGGNHAQFGNYGEQKGDPNATISSDEQQNIAVAAIQEFLEMKILK